MSTFDGKVAVVTGAASGIGAALSAALVEHGARVVMTDIDGNAMRAAGGRELDVRDGDAVRALIDAVVREFGVIDFLFNNAGISMGGPSHELTTEHWNRIIDVNLRGVTNGVVAAYPLMIDQGHGHIVNTASGAGLVPPPLVLPYATTKHAVVGLSLGLRPEAALRNVCVSVLCPGAVETPILDRLPDADLPLTASEPVTARRYLAKIRQKPIDADRLARGALAGVARNKAIIVVPRSAASLWYLQRMSPALVSRISRTLARKVERDLVRPRR